MMPARDWITAHLANRPATVFHGDLLPQNLLWDFMGDGRVSVIDWERAGIGDPAYHLALFTRVARKPLKESGGFQRTRNNSLVARSHRSPLQQRGALATVQRKDKTGVRGL